MRVFKKSLLSACVALALVLLIPSMNVYAAETYTVTFRPGNVGTFREEAVTQMKSLYGENNVTVTTHGAIKVTVSAEADIPSAPNYIQVNEGYFVKSGWASHEGCVDRDMDFVVDYARLVDGVEYTIEYVDSASGESIAPSYIAQANIGDERTESAPLQIVISGGTVYNLSSAASVTLVLDADATKNVFTFEYTMAPRGTIIEEVIIGEDGEIITTTDYITTTINNGTTVVQGGAAAGGAGDGAAGAGDGDAEGGEAVEIIDEETPLADGNDNSAVEEPAGMVEIGEEEVPLADGEEPMANMALIGASVFGAGAVILAGLWLYMKKKRVKAEITSQED